MKRALISVSDKVGIIEFAKELNSLGYQIISTGGTFKKLKSNDIDVIGISEVTGFPECLEGRVKTLHPAVHGGLLAKRDSKEHMDQIKELNIETIDIVVVNLYPFKSTIEKEGVAFEEAVENIDIGGPTMLRSAAKNHNDVVVVVDPEDYSKVITEIKEEGVVTKDTKLHLAYKVFAHTSAYDALIAEYLRNAAKLDAFRETITLTYEKIQDLRYGENPFQKAAFYKEATGKFSGLTNAIQLHGKELSYNNINDANGALELLKEFEGPAVVAVKHANPCGVGVAHNGHEAYIKAYNGDPISIFGGIVACNREITKETADEIAKIFVEIVIAPSFSEEALHILTKKKNIRVLELEAIGEKISGRSFDMKKVIGGLLYQTYNTEMYDDEDIKCVTDTKPTKSQLEDMKFAMKVVKHTKSNAIVLVKDGQTLGIGSGQLNRISATELAIKSAVANGLDTSCSVLSSDAFFPFSDCVEAAVKVGVKAIIQPGGSLRDQESIDACNKYGIAMIFTGKRHFKH